MQAILQRKPKQVGHSWVRKTQALAPRLQSDLSPVDPCRPFHSINHSKMKTPTTATVVRITIVQSGVSKHEADSYIPHCHCSRLSNTTRKQWRP